MRMLNRESLSRGKILIDYAFSDKGKHLSLETADLIGIVAAYIADGHLICEMEATLTERLGPIIAIDAQRTFETFDDFNNRGLWNQGPAIEDIVFTNAKLNRFYPGVARRWGMRGYDALPSCATSLDKFPDDLMDGPAAHNDRQHSETDTLKN